MTSRHLLTLGLTLLLTARAGYFFRECKAYRFSAHTIYVSNFGMYVSKFETYVSRFEIYVSKFET